MDRTLDGLGIISGVGFLTGGAVFIYISHRDRKYPGQKKLGYAFAVIGAALLLARVLGLSIF